MAIDTGRFTGFAAGAVSSTEIEEHVAALEEFINGGIQSSDLKSTSAWVGHRHIDAPDFFGSPAPRWEGVSQVVHHRRVGERLEDAAVYVDDVAPNKWVAIPGLSAVVRSHPQVTRTVGLEVAATWFTYEAQGSITYSYTTIETSAQLCATFGLFIDDVLQEGTLRPLYRATSSAIRGTRKHHSINFYQPGLSDGTHHVCIKVKVPQSTLTTDQSSFGAGKRVHKYIFVQTRVLSAKVVYL